MPVSEAAQRAPIIGMILFAYAVGVASLVCIHMPVVTYGAMVLGPLALLLLGYGLWALTRPATRKTYLFFGLGLILLLALGGLLYVFATEMAAFAAVEQHNGVTAELLGRHKSRLLLLTALYTAGTALLTGALYPLLHPEKRHLLQLFMLSWGALPILFLLMKLYGVLFELLPGLGLFVLFILWLLAAGLIGYGAYKMTEGNRLYTALLTALAFFAPPIGAATFVIFVFLRILSSSNGVNAGAAAVSHR